MYNYDGKIEIFKDPYDSGFDISYAEFFQFKPGITTLVGCNGAGKSTVLNCIKEAVHKKDDIYFGDYDNLHNGGSNLNSKLSFLNDFEGLATRMMSSEGENIYDSFIHLFIAPITKLLRNPEKSFKEYWLVFDAFDSGLSIDQIEEIKEFMLNCFLPDNKDKKIYVVFTANTYALACGTDCINVWSGEHKEYNSYEDYKNAILESRKYKDNRRKNNE